MQASRVLYVGSDESACVTQAYSLVVERSNHCTAVNVRAVKERVEIRQQRVANAHYVTRRQRHVVTECARVLRLTHDTTHFVQNFK